jgi:hypothetical protein
LGLLENIFSTDLVPEATMSTPLEIMSTTGTGVQAILVSILMIFFAMGMSTIFLTTIAPFFMKSLVFSTPFRKASLNLAQLCITPIVRKINQLVF